MYQVQVLFTTVYLTILSSSFLTHLHVHFAQAQATSAFFPAPTNSSAQRSVDGLLNAAFRIVGGCQDPLRIGPQWLRAAFHDAGTFNKARNTGGADGSLMWEALALAKEHAGLFSILPADITTGLSAADTIQLGGKFAVEACGGPTNMPFRTGRRDVRLFTRNANVSALPDPFIDVASLKARFAAMGLSPKDMLVLTTGSHTIGGATRLGSPTLDAFKDNKKTFVAFDRTPDVFDNDIWKLVLTNTCILPIDCNFAKDPTLLPLIQLYANNQTAFFQDYSASFTKMTELSSNAKYSPFLNIRIPK